ncbi:MAG: H4MPT-linked C1 transfer pathway protein [Burkholderiales bacterium]|nr:H4MPT-linked C1 transfer pathway protein [Burkholderiales bacterium]
MPMRDAVLGWDVGGAHLKAVLIDVDGAARLALELPCPLWQGVSHLGRAIEEILSRIPVDPAAHAVTMTGELADCFTDRALGIAAIADALSARVPADRLHVFAGRRGFLPVSGLAAATAAIASANWLASAMYLATVIGEALLVDIGSTTTDLAPVAGGNVLVIGDDDFTRLAADELVYTGITRTPLMSVAERAPFEGRQVGLMAEHFATTADVHRLTGELAERADLHPSADRGPKTVEGSARRLARMVGRDAASAPIDAWRELARFFADRQLERLVAAAGRVAARGGLSAQAPVVGAGVGIFLARRLAARLDRSCVDFATLVRRVGAAADDLMACAPAFAVAHLLGTSRQGVRR